MNEPAPPAAESDDERAARSIAALLAATGGVVTFDAARRVYASLGRPYPGDDVIAERYPAARTAEPADRAGPGTTA